MRPTNTRYRNSQDQFSDADLAPSIGGSIIQLQAGGTLLIGDIVQAGGTDIVVKATTNITRVVGVVVGGASFQGDGQVFEGNVTSGAALIATGLTAAILGQMVYVMVRGVFYIPMDGVVANGALIKPSGTTAGYGTSATASTDAGGIVGKLLDVASAVSGDTRKCLIALM